LAHAGQALGLRVLGEFFADRPYDGTEVTMSGWTWRADRHGLGRGRPVAKMLADPRLTWPKRFACTPTLRTRR
jgi:hypothetical protein